MVLAQGFEVRYLVAGIYMIKSNTLGISHLTNVAKLQLSEMVCGPAAGMTVKSAK